MELRDLLTCFCSGELPTLQFLQKDLRNLEKKLRNLLTSFFSKATKSEAPH